MKTSPLTAEPEMPEDPHAGASPNARLLAGGVPHGVNDPVRFGGGFVASAISHVIGFVLIVYAGA
jgi:hypothetical protein